MSFGHNVRFRTGKLVECALVLFLETSEKAFVPALEQLIGATLIIRDSPAACSSVAFLYPRAQWHHVPETWGVVSGSFHMGKLIWRHVLVGWDLLVE